MAELEWHPAIRISLQLTKFNQFYAQSSPAVDEWSTPMSLTENFSDDPVGFLKDWIVVVQDDSKGVPKQDLEYFYLVRANENLKGNNYVFLMRKKANQNPEVTIPGYWLPWNKGEASVLKLGDKAKFMFTSEMTNCRFSVLTADMACPTVAHVEGTGNFSQRDSFETAKGLPSRKDDVDKKMRRLSASGIKNMTRDVKDTSPKHNYWGQDGAVKSSAFVFGYCKDTTWKFYAQIVSGVMAGSGMNALKTAKDKVVPLDQAYEIA